MTFSASARILALTPTERDVALDYLRDESKALWSIGTSVRINHPIDPERWRRSAELCHTRATFPRLCLEIGQGGELALRVEPSAPFCFERRKAQAPHQTLANAIATSLDWTKTGHSINWLIEEQEGGAWHAAISMPHLVGDGHTTRRYLEAVYRTYCAEAAAEANGDESNEFEARAAFAKAENERFDQPQSLAFWKQRLEKLAPLKFRTPQLEHVEYIDERVKLGADLSQRIAGYCSQKGIPPPTFFLGLLAILLERYREPGGDFLIHSLRGTRTPSISNADGCFYEVVPYLAESGQLALAKPLNEIFANFASQRRRAGKPAAISMLELSRLKSFVLGEGAHVNKRVIFNYYDFWEVQLDQKREMEIYFSHAAEEAHMIVMPGSEGFTLRFRGSTDGFGVRGFVKRLAQLAEQTVGGARTVGDLNWLLEHERAFYLRPRISSPRDKPGVLACFERRAIETPGDPALMQGTTRLTYGEVARRAAQVATFLQECGVKQGELVALHLPRSIDQIVGMLGILKAGAAYLPLDPGQPTERLRFMAEDSGVRVVIGEGESFGGLPVFNVSTMLSAKQKAALEQTHHDPELPAYLIYTSGTTGQPKGVLVSRRNVDRLFQVTEKTFAFGASDVVPMLHSPAFDFSVWEIWSALAYGGQLAILPPCEVRDPDQLMAALRRVGATVLNQTPSAFYALMDVARARGADALAGLRLVAFGGEELDPRRLAACFNTQSAARVAFYNLYGITETTVHVTCRQLMPTDATRSFPRSPIGQALADLSVYVVDQEGQLVPEGVSGEILVGGDGVSGGYVGRPDLTAQRFIDDPFHPDGGRVYRTGDLARLVPEGELDYLGRLDDQVQVRGFRVELGEIEHVLMRHPVVSAACVVMRPDVHGQPKLLAYLQARPAGQLKEDDIRDHLARALPDYMQCHHFIVLDEFPLTANGKIDKRRLPDPDAVSKHTSKTSEPGDEHLGHVLAAARSTLGREVPSTGFSFIALGGDSLSAIQFALRLGERLGRLVTVSQVLSARDLAALAKELQGTSQDNSVGQMMQLPLSPRDDRTEFPLTFAQARVWQMQRDHPSCVAYDFNAALHFEGCCRHEHVEQALNMLVERHEVLRTSFHQSAEGPIQRVHPFAPFTVPHLEARTPEAWERYEMDRRARSLEPMPLEQAPLVKWEFVTRADDHHILFQREHHLLHDGWSFLVLVDELLEILRALAEGRMPQLPPLPYQLGDFARAHREWMKGEVAGKQRAYWKRRLRGAGQPLPLPNDFVRPEIPRFRGAQKRFSLTASAVEPLRQLCSSESTTLFCGLLAVFTAVMRRFSGARDFCIGSGVAGRHWERCERVVGMLINNLALRIELGERPTFREALQAAREAVTGALANQDLPYEQIVEVAAPPRLPGVPPLCQIFFSAYDGAFPDCRLPGGGRLRLEPLLDNGGAKFDLNVIIVTVPSDNTEDMGKRRVDLIWEYSTDVYESTTIEQWIDDFRRLLEFAPAEPDQAIDLLAADDHRVTAPYVALNRTSCPYPDDPLHALFARRNTLHPQAAAIMTQRETLTYDELHRRASAVASALVEAGHLSGNCVAFVMSNRRDAIVAMLGILMAGGCYLPIDPKDPPARVASLLSLAEVKHVLVAHQDAPASPGVKRLVFGELKPVEGAFPSAPVSAAAPAYILFTSGSTGSPKAVRVPHRAVVRLLFPADYVQIAEGERILQLAPLAFDASTFEIWAPLLHGGTVVTYPGSTFDLDTFTSVVRSHQVTTLWLTASLFNHLIEIRPEALQAVRQIITGGDALSPHHVRRAQELLPQTRLINGYGPTESTTFALTHIVEKQVQPEAARIPIGRPLANTTAWILGAEDQCVPPGAPGELYLGGDGLAIDYFGDSEETQRRFRTLALSDGSISRVYQTGDRARLKGDGSVDFLGRLDDQVKIGGFRIEPGEVQQVLRTIPGVQDAAVVAAPPKSEGEKRLLAAVALSPGGTLTATELKARMGAVLPRHAIPAVILVMDRLPLTTQGKLDKNALFRLAEANKNHATEEMAGTAVAMLVENLWQEVIGEAPQGPDADFFEAGGNSLSAISLILAVERTFHVQFKTHQFLRAPTPRGLVSVVEEALGGGSAEGRARHFIPLRGWGSGAPLVIVPGGYGGENELLVFAKIARLLEWPGSVFGVRSRVGGQASNGMYTTATRARRHTEELLSLWPEGAACLVGECIAAPLAFEMACCLDDAGRRPGALILLDARAPRWWRPYWMRVREWTARLRHRVFPTNPPSVLACLPSDVRRYYNRLWSFRPRSYVGDVHLVISRDLGGDETAQAARWQRYVKGQVFVHRVEGSHDEYIRAKATQAAQLLDGIMIRASSTDVDARLG